MGIRCGVKDNAMGSSAMEESSCSISGVWRCVATPYALTDSLHSAKSVAVFAFLPAPDTPDLASMIIEEGSIALALSKAG